MSDFRGIRSLVIKNKLMSMRGRVLIHHADGTQAYDATCAFGMTPLWTVTRAGEPSMTVQRKMWTRATWNVGDAGGSYTIRQQFTWFKRTYVVEGGRFHHAAITGNHFDRKFSIMYNGMELASATRQSPTLRDEYSIAVLCDDDEAERLAVAVLLVLLLQRREATQEQERH
jgi:uncharacterized protein YxjI